jgi:hypothetical protein
MDLYNSIGANDVSFEIVFVGPKEPGYELPSNFRFFKSDTKPAQCFEIASRLATADLIMPIADDCEFRTSRPLDALYNAYKAHNDEKAILSCRYLLNGELQPIGQHRFFIDDNRSPVMPLCGLMARKLYRDIGGIDKNFIAVMWDLDVTMRVLASGGRVLFSDVHIDELKSKAAGSNLCGDFWHHDRALLESLWTADGHVHFERARQVEPFSDLRIMEVSQGPRGRWRGTGPVLLEKWRDFWKKVENFLKKDRALLSRANRAIRNPGKSLRYGRHVLASVARRSNPL